MIPRYFHNQFVTLALKNMPKKAVKGVTVATASNSKKATSKHSQSQVPPAADVKSPVIQTKDGNFSIAIQVKPGAKTNSVTGISDEVVSIQIAAPPVDGEANTAIVKYFAELLKVKKTEVSIKGGKSRQKTITVQSISPNQLTASNILEMLSSEVKK